MTVGYSLLRGLFGSFGAASAPTAGFHPVGERVYNSNPTNGAPVGWVCVSAGVPGTWLPFGTIGSGVSYSGLRRLVVFAWGESGLGPGGPAYAGSTVPSGFPDLTGRVSFYTASRIRTLPIEEPRYWGPSPVETNFDLDPINAGRISWADRFAYLVAQRLPSDIEVMLCLCAKGGTKTTDWAVGGTLYNAAIARVQSALTLKGASLGCIVTDLGINEDAAGEAAGWASRMTTIETAMRAALGNTTCPWFYRVQYATPDVPTVRAEQTSWAKSTVPLRIAVTSPNGPFDGAGLHLTDSPTFTQAQTAATLEATYNVNLDTPAVAFDVPSLSAITSKSSVIEVFEPSGYNPSTGDWTGSKAGYVASQATAGKRPTYQADAGNGRPGLRFTASSSQTLALPSALAAQYTAGTRFSVFVALRMATASDNAIVSLGKVSDGNLSTMLFVTSLSGEVAALRLDRYAGGVFKSGLSQTKWSKVGVPTVAGVVHNNAAANTTQFYAQSGMYLRDFDQDTNIVVAAPDTGRIGCYIAGTGEYFYFDGHISGVVFADNPSSADIEDICQRLYSIRP